MRVHAQDQPQSRVPAPSGAAHVRQASPAADRSADHPPRPSRDERASQENPSIEASAGNPTAMGWIQRKPVLNWPGDRFEREADDVADRVIRMSEPPSGGMAATALPPEGTGTTIQAKAGSSTAQPDSKAAERAAEQGGAPLSEELRSYFEPRFGHDFSRVRVHANGEAASAARSIDARAYTIGSDIVFGSGEYAPDAQEGRRLLAHELTHVVQQGGVGKGTIQRSAIASWTNIKSEEKIHFLGEKDQGKYLKQQERIKNNKEVKDPIELPKVEKMLVITANYHHYDKYPTPEGGTFEFDKAIADEAKRQFRVGTTLDFWPNIKWKTREGVISDIGVRFNITFMPHTRPEESKDMENYIGSSLHRDEDVRTKSEHNIFLIRDIDNASEHGINMDMTLRAAKDAGLTGFESGVLEDGTRIVTYTPSKGGAPVQYKIPEDALTVIRLVREEAKAKGVEKKIENTVLGLGSENAITLDVNKSAPPVKTFNKYEPMDDIEYKSYEKEALTKKTEKKFTKEEQIKRAGAVVTHEIGHNIGMGHTDFGIMNESTEKDTFIRTATNIRDPGEISSGTTFNFTNRIYEVTFESGVESMTHENVQLLANRMQTMTNYVLSRPAREAGATKPSLDAYWTESVDTLRPLLQAENYESIFADDRYATMLAIPYQDNLQKNLIDEGRITSDDRINIRNGMSKEGRLNLEGWKLLSEGARKYIKTETLRLMGEAFSGVTFFTSKEESEKY